jgi:hypothetical protein
MTECPECGSHDMVRTPGLLPVCRSCDWTGWEPTPTVEPPTYESRSARILRDNLSGTVVWSPERGWHDGATR